MDFQADLPIGQPFVDLGPIFGYSRGLARCCAWGLGVLTRTYSDGCFGQGLAGCIGTGHRLRDQEIWPGTARVPMGTDSRSFSPEQICLAVGRF